MASKARKLCEYSEEDALYVGRLLYDVLKYTLTKCGLPETRLPTIDSKENVYNRANFVEVAAASVLRVSLILRDRWKRMFISRHNSHGLNDQNVLCFLAQITLCSPLSRRRITQSMVELFLASCNEIMLFFHHENITIDFNLLLESMGVYIMGLLRSNQDASETIEDLFDEFDNISDCIKWITGFITDFAIPYGSRDDVSAIFFKNVMKQYQDALIKLRDQLGFLPHDLVALLTEESVLLPENLVLESGPIPSGDRESSGPIPPSGDSESSGPPILPASSERDALEERKSDGRRSTLSTNVSEQTPQGGQNSSAMGLEDDLRQMNLGAEADSLESLREIPKRKTSKKKKNKKKGS